MYYRETVRVRNPSMNFPLVPAATIWKVFVTTNKLSEAFGQHLFHQWCASIIYSHIYLDICCYRVSPVYQLLDILYWPTTYPTSHLEFQILHLANILAMVDSRYEIKKNGVLQPFCVTFWTRWNHYWTKQFCNLFEALNMEQFLKFWELDH